MEFFDKLGKKASEAYKATADKTGKIAKETKIKLKMGELKSQISDLYEEIGKKVYEKHVREEEYSIKGDIEELCTKIDVISDEIESMLKECLDLKDKKQCSKCHTEIEKEAKFCHECGQEQMQEPAREVEIIEENKEDSSVENLEKTVEVESSSKIQEGQNEEQIEMEEEDKLDD